MRRTIPIAVDLVHPTEFWASTRPGPGGCIEWTGAIDKKGYGRIRRDGVDYLAHRVALAISGVPLPDGAPGDHECRNPRCVNVKHIEVTTTRVNTARGIGPTAQAIRLRDEGTCTNGHRLAEVGFHKQRNGLTCAQCGRDRVRRYKARRASA